MPRTDHLHSLPPLTHGEWTLCRHFDPLQWDLIVHHDIQPLDEELPPTTSYLLYLLLNDVIPDNSQFRQIRRFAGRNMMNCYSQVTFCFYSAGYPSFFSAGRVPNIKFFVDILLQRMVVETDAWILGSEFELLLPAWWHTHWSPSNFKREMTPGKVTVPTSTPMH